VVRRNRRTARAVAPSTPRSVAQERRSR
jgi:hypothetical protein